MKILHVITSLKTGGAEKLMVELLPRLKTKGVEVDLCIFDGERTTFYKELFNKGIRIIDFGIGNNVYHFRNIFRLKKLMNDYDIIHSHNFSPQLFTAIANIGLKKRLITTEHNTNNRRRNWPGFFIVDKWMYNRYDSVICISDKAEENLREYVPDSQSNISTIYNGVDVSKYYGAVSSFEFKKYLPTDNGSKSIVMVASFRTQKDQETLIKSIAFFPDNFHLFLVGDGPKRTDCEFLSQKLGLNNRIHFLGIRSDIPQLLHAADYVVMSSHFEGLSLSSVEGMCVGKPFIASDVDGLREVVSGAGILFSHQDSLALANEIIKLDNDPQLYKSVAAACLARARQFDISTMVDGYINLYDN